MATDLDLAEAIELLALEMTGRRGMPQEARTWEDLGPITYATLRGEAKEVIDLVAPLIMPRGRRARPPSRRRHADRVVGHAQRPASAGHLVRRDVDGAVRLRELWRQEDPRARAKVLPDLGGLLEWLMAEIKRLRVVEAAVRRGAKIPEARWRMLQTSGHLWGWGALAPEEKAPMGTPARISPADSDRIVDAALGRVRELMEM